jgi:hypothetical protein
MDMDGKRRMNESCGGARTNIEIFKIPDSSRDLGCVPPFSIPWSNDPH